MILFNKKLVNKCSTSTDALSELQEILYLTEGAGGKGFALNPDKEWDSDTLARIGELANKYGLRPNKIVRFK